MFRIGDFSRLTRISIKMLRYYDEVGLIKPEATDPFTGYRSYSVHQIPRVNRITTLRDMGFSIKEIQSFLDGGDDAGRLMELLEKRMDTINDSIAKEREKLLRVGYYMNLLKQGEGPMQYEVIVKSIPEYKVLSVRGVIPSYDREGDLWRELQEFMGSKGIKGLHPCYAVYHDPGYKDSDVDVEVTSAVGEDVEPSGRIVVRTLEGVPEMAVVLHKGPFNEMSRAYNALGAWMEANGYRMCGPTRAIYHTGPWCEANPADYLTEIQAPVTKAVAE